ncbi:MAG: outer membrane protein [Hyphomicrobiaceae bacterium]
MRAKTLCLCAAIALMGTATAAEAGDLGGSIKDGAGIAIPAPIPVVETFKWYLRADLGGGLVKATDPTTQGNLYGFDRDPLDGPAFGMRSSWFQNGFDTFTVGGIGAGLYITPRLRADATVDTRTKSDIEAEGSFAYRGDPAIYGNVQNRNHVFNTTGTPYAARITGQSKEETQVRDTVALFNGYLDLAERGSRFVPYIGAGLGFAVRTVDRRHTTTQQVWDTSTDPTGPILVTTNALVGKSKAHEFVPVASATAGVGYTLSNGMVLDLNYRYTYIPGVDSTTNMTFDSAINGVSAAANRITVGDTHEHAIRAGLRWNVW